MNQELTREDMGILRYFWEEYRDITRYSKYEEILSTLKKEHPEIVKAWEEYKVAKQRLNGLFSDF